MPMTTAPTTSRRPRPVKPAMRLRNIRTTDALWSDFGDLCADEDTDVSAELRAFMEQRLTRARRRGWRPTRES